MIHGYLNPSLTVFPGKNIQTEPEPQLASTFLSIWMARTPLDLNTTPWPDPTKPFLHNNFYELELTSNYIPKPPHPPLLDPPPSHAHNIKPQLSQEPQRHTKNRNLQPAHHHFSPLLHPTGQDPYTHQEHYYLESHTSDPLPSSTRLP